ncbi:DnaJ-domain-containing protein [Calocera viscosa TUFC12733]|uniref:DnaJ-domain-containing protein n=1 Tax=Calocera viscosa (strain TUFC12733) TaxID=1330018 RepID=A0A167S0A7_CALVF|nr:DnaJ-domain-containing protein [Calocera viscosa TUFC12733]
MESNKDEALKCLRVAQRHRDNGNYSSAARFCQKSITLFSTTEAIELAAIIEAEAASASSSAADSPEGASTSTESHPSASTTKHRSNGADTSAPKENGDSSSSQKREYTAEMVAVVKRVRGCKVTEYYEILSVSRQCEENDVKRAYRKLALQLHPDKNSAPGADEAFKMVSKAFQILSDPQKRAAFDQHGADPDSRSSGMSSARSGFSNASSRYDGFESEISPEDLFNMFFGGSGAGQFASTGFGPGSGFTFHFGGPGGVQFNSARGRPRGQQAAPNDTGSMFKQLLPLLIVILFSLLTSLPSLLGSFQTPDPSFSFQPTQYFDQERYTLSRNVPYYVNTRQFTKHPIWDSIPVDRRQEVRAGKASSKLKTFEGHVESSYASVLQNQCRREEDYREQRIQSEIGLFGIGTNWQAVERIRGEKLPSCEKLSEFLQASY